MDVMLKQASTALASSLVGGVGGASGAPSLAVFQQMEKHPPFEGARFRPRSLTSEIARWAYMPMNGFSLRAYWHL